MEVEFRLLCRTLRLLANEWDWQHAQNRGGFQTAVEIDLAKADTVQRIGVGKTI